MIYYLFIFIFLAFAFTIMLCLVTCISCLGLTGSAKNLLVRFGSRSYDRQFEEQSHRQPSNTDCFICLERVKNEVVATCSHSYCGKNLVIQPNASLNILPVKEINQ